MFVLPAPRRALIAMGALFVLTAAASAQRDPGATMVGDWRGFGQSATDGRFIDPCWDIERGQGRLFHGTVKFAAPGELEPCLFEADFVIAPDGTVNGAGGDDDHLIFLSGKVRAFGDGSVRITALAYVLFDRQFNFNDLGAFAVMQEMGGANWDLTPGADVGGHRDGTYIARAGGIPGGGCLEADLVNIGGGREQGFTTQVGGSMMFEDVLIARNTRADLPMGVEGTIAPPEPIRGSSFGALGTVNPGPPGTQGIIAILIGLQPPPEPERPSTIVGSYRLYRNVFEVFFETVAGGNRSFSEGTFSLPAVQRG